MADLKNRRAWRSGGRSCSGEHARAGPTGSKGSRWINDANARRQMAFHEMRLYATARRRPNRLHAAASCASSANGDEWAPGSASGAGACVRNATGRRWRGDVQSATGIGTQRCRRWTGGVSRAALFQATAASEAYRSRRQKKT